MCGIWFEIGHLAVGESKTRIAIQQQVKENRKGRAHDMDHEVIQIDLAHVAVRLEVARQCFCRLH